MQRSIGLDLLLSLILTSSMLFGLAAFPQNPDGAEMLNTALFGGVMHPSGMALQAWINRAFVVATPFSPGWTLSFVSWLGHLGSVFVLLRLLASLQMSRPVQCFAVAAFAYLPVLWRLALQPEKYTWLCFTLLMSLYAFWLSVSQGGRRWLYFSALACAMAIGQHSSALILLPALFITIALHVRRCKGDWPVALTALALFLIVLSGLQASLLYLRTEATWVDWGHLQTLGDVWKHFRRADYSVTQLHHYVDAEEATISGLDMAAREFSAFPLGLFFVAVGGYAAVIRNRIYASLILLTLVGALVVLKLAELPTADLQTALGYAERYPILAWPMVVLLAGFGLEWSLLNFPRKKTLILLLVAVSVAYLAFKGAPGAFAVNNNLVDLYRREVVRELPTQRILFSASDYELFYGFPCPERPCYPLKNMFAYDWYRTSVAPLLAPEIQPVINSLGLRWTLPDFFRGLLRRGLTLASTSATAMLKHQDLMNSAEQVGVVWLFNSGPQQLYSERIVQNSLSICKVLDEAWIGLPPNGNYFAHEILDNFHFAVQGAADYLNATGRTIPGSKADQLAKALKSGVEPGEWKRLCQAYQMSF